MWKNAKYETRMGNAKIPREISSKCGMWNAALHIDKCGMRNADFHRDIINKCRMRNMALHIDKCRMRTAEK